jgi:hypothetical protein
MRRFGGRNGGILATLFFVLLVSVLAFFLPAINQFRLASQPTSNGAFVLQLGRFK